MATHDQKPLGFFQVAFLWKPYISCQLSTTILSYVYTVLLKCNVTCTCNLVHRLSWASLELSSSLTQLDAWQQSSHWWVVKASDTLWNLVCFAWNHWSHTLNWNQKSLSLELNYIHFWFPLYHMNPILLYI